jgi:hypothetical protein
MAEPLTTVATVRGLLERPTLADTDPKTVALIAVASRLARTLAPGIDDRIAAGELTADEAAAVVGLVVAAAMQNPEGARTISRTRGPFSESITFPDGSSGDVVFSASMIRALGGEVDDAPRRRVRNIRLTPGLA